MSDDLISRRAALDDAHRQIWYRLNLNMKERIDTWLVNLPAVQPKQKIGRWIKTDDYDAWRCSECEEYFCLDEGTPQDNEYYYCPCCGAKMESDNNDS